MRGTAQQVFEKYVTLARDAQSAGDRIASENFFQHAEHYYRIMNADGGADSRNRRRNGEDFHNDDGLPFGDDDQPAAENQGQDAQESASESGNGPGNGSGSGQGNGKDGNGQHGEPADAAPKQAGSPDDTENQQAAAAQDDAPEGEQQQASEVNP